MCVADVDATLVNTCMCMTSGRAEESLAETPPYQMIRRGPLANQTLYIVHHTVKLHFV
jgi:hypothetical protein